MLQTLTTFQNLYTAPKSTLNQISLLFNNFGSIYAFGGL